MTRTLTFEGRLDVLKDASVKSTLTDIRHGVERETLRINENGSLALTPHPQTLGAALTHDLITTDFSESLLEFITPPERKPETTLSQLRDIHRFVAKNIGQERLWPMSMPCFIENEDSIPLAKYGNSNVGKMKTLYRKGLKNRYGSMMQAISGVHFNFSLPDSFWTAWLEKTHTGTVDKDSISAAYFGMIRNYRRLCWMIPYLFGASPALCGSFVKGKKTSLPFESLGNGTIYLPYATSLRMSDLGYTNSAQSGLMICYNDVNSYIASLRAAKSSPSQAYQKFAPENGEYQQLNANVLQIENELYSPVRPKQPTQSLEKPTDALEARGVNYIEVRALDVDPFSDVGISPDHFYFLDIFMVYCLIAPSSAFTRESYQETEDNLKKVVIEGRAPSLTLSKDKTSIEMKQWAEEVFESFRSIAKILDEVNETTTFSEALERQWLKFVDPSNTPSGRLLNLLKVQNKDNGILGREMAEEYRARFLTEAYELTHESDFVHMATQSINAQKDIESNDKLSFETFLQEYFADLAHYSTDSLKTIIQQGCA
ncbi:glutamate--cysteine ligase [Aestuariibacter sp. AA17]|uniref:Glutamate--cysteine ligase n=1 Tax=Fluctibacter corallii TaxID=2984329 RepID=A0ABT3A333_9ALTE|nr:glutamate--cysteine ligase [Aestuariibacter sp. AA17]MCV2883105.1 glutamate--cysteine ligase [Aestuariibacter sp. AA17]